MRPATPAEPAQLLLTIAYLGFVSLGLPDPVAGVAWPSVREEFGLAQDRFGWIFIGLGCGYCVSGFFGGRLTQVIGLGRLLWTSSALVAAAMFGSGAAGAWWPIVVCAALWGLGSGGIDAGLNAYASHHFSAKHMNWLHACYSIGATLGPWLMTAMIVVAGSWRAGYAIVGTALAAMALLFFATGKMWDDDDDAVDDNAASRAEAAPAVSVGEVLGDRLVGLQISLFFLYVGLEFTVGQWSFTLLTEERGVPADWAGALAGAYYAAIGVGRVAAGLVVARLGLDRLIRATLAVALVGTLLYAAAPTQVIGCAGLLVVGLGLAPVFPCLMTRTPQRIGTERAAHAVGFQVSAGMLGAALMPSLAGTLGRFGGLETIAQFAVVLAVALFLVHELTLRVHAHRTASATKQ
ncbi:MAG: MFS transporter [Pirellulales bacterium]